jgi:tellurite resistance protein TehA-like permease
MPVVPPMVSAATGALLVPYLPDGQLRVTMLLGCYAMFGLSLAASALVIGRIWDQVLHHGIGPAAMVPTLWIVLGPVGQSITAVNLLANAAPSALPAAYVPGAAAFALFYGLAAWGFAMLWLTIAAVATVRTARAHLPFTLTWWSFTFPVGTLVTAASGLSARTGLVVFTTAAVGLFGFLVVTWAVVLIRTLRGLAAGDLLTPMPLPTS